MPAGIVSWRSRIIRKAERNRAVTDRREAAAPAAERVPPERHEERHRADCDHPAEVIEHVHEREARLVQHDRAGFPEKDDEPLRLLGGNDAAADGRFEVSFGEGRHDGIIPEGKEFFVIAATVIPASAGIQGRLPRGGRPEFFLLVIPAYAGIQVDLLHRVADPGLVTFPARPGKVTKKEAAPGSPPLVVVSLCCSP